MSDLTDNVSAGDRAHPRRGLAIGVGLAAALIAAAYAVFWFVQLRTLEGGDRVVMLNTLIGFAMLGLLWNALAVGSLAAIQRMPEPRFAASVPAYVAFTFTGICVMMTVVTLFI